MTKRWSPTLLMLFVLALLSVGCAGSTPTAAPITPATYADPFDYCAAVGTADTPGAPYAGPETPEEVVTALRSALGTPADAPMEPFKAGTFWRCMGGQAWGCFVGANLPCTTKADTGRTPSSEMNDFCKANPKSDVIPAYVTGRATVYEWRCTDGAPAIVKQVVEVDTQGYQSNIWYELSPTE
jgi:hypothetical protein